MSEADLDLTPIAWYRSPVDREVLRDLNRRSDLAGFAQILSHLALVAGLGALVYVSWYRWPWYATAALFFLFATVNSYLNVGAAGHELSHGTVFRTPFWNELFIRITGFLSWTNFHYFRASHRQHHQFTVHRPQELEVVLPQKVQRRTWLYIFAFSPEDIARKLVMHGRRSLGIIRGEWELRLFPPSEPAKRTALIRWSRFLLVGHVVLAAVFIYFQQWPLLLMVTFGTFCCSWLNYLTAMPQHIGLRPNVPDFRLCCRTMTLGPVSRFLYWNMNYHIEHHMYAAVPFHKLPRLHLLIEADLPASPRGLWATWREILPILRRQKIDPAYVHDPALPAPREPVDQRA